MYGSNLQRHTAEAELRRGEHLLWVGQPSPVRLAMQKLPTLLFGILWTAAIIFMSNMVGWSFSSSGNFGSFSMIFTVLLGIFFLIGVGMLVSPLWNYFKATRTIYAVTDQRAMIIEQLLSTSVKSYSDDDIQFIERRTSIGDTGDVIFARETRTRRSRSSSGFSRTRTYNVDIGFFGIPEPREVEQILLDNFRTKR